MKIKFLAVSLIFSACSFYTPSDGDILLSGTHSVSLRKGSSESSLVSLDGKVYSGVVHFDGNEEFEVMIDGKTYGVQETIFYVPITFELVKAQKVKLSGMPQEDYTVKVDVERGSLSLEISGKTYTYLVVLSSVSDDGTNWIGACGSLYPAEVSESKRISNLALWDSEPATKMEFAGRFDSLFVWRWKTTYLKSGQIIEWQPRLNGSDWFASGKNIVAVGGEASVVKGW